MSEEIQYEDFFDNNIRDKIIALKKELKELDEVYEDLIKTIKKNRDVGNQIVADGSGKETKERIESTQKLDKAINKAIATDKEKLKASQALEKQRQKGLAQLAKQEHAQKELIRLANMEVKSEEDLIKQTNALVKLRKKLDTTTDGAAKEEKEFTDRINKNTQALKKSDAAIDRHQRNVGNYPKRFDKAKKAFMSWTTAMKSSIILGLVAGIVKGLKTLVTSSAEYEKSLSSLQAITGVSNKELGFFADKSKEFSAITLQSANDVVKAFEKVGSLRPELLKDSVALAEVTKQSIILSEATGGKLGLEDAAKATAGTLNQFALASSDAARVTNALAAGSKFGSAGILEQSQAFKNYGAVAADANITLEQSIGLIQVAAEKSIIGAEAGTKLRGVTLKLQQAGVGYASGQFNINDSLTEANELLNAQSTAAEKDQLAIRLFGAENITLGKVLLNNQDKFKQYTKDVTGTNIAIEQQQIQNDNLAANWKKLINKITNALTSSKVSGFLNNLVKGIFDFIKTFNEFRKRTVDGFNDLIRTSATFRAVIQGIKSAFNILRETVVQNFKLMIAPFKLIGKIAQRIFKKEFGEIKNDIKDFGVGVKDSLVSIGTTAIEEGKKVKDAFEGANLESMLIDTTKASDDLTTSFENQTKAVNDLNEATNELTKKELKKIADVSEARNAEFNEINEMNIERANAEFEANEDLQEMLENLKDEAVNNDINRLNNERQREIDDINVSMANAELKGMTLLAINTKYDKAISAMQTIQRNGMLAATAETLKSAGDLFEKHTLAYKILATAEAGINTYLSATAAYKAMAGIPIIGPALGVIAAATAVATGLKSIAKINAINIPGFKDGVVDIDGQGTAKSDSILTRLSKGETVHTAEDTVTYRNTHEAINKKESKQGVMNALIKDTGIDPYNPTMLGLNKKMYVEKDNSNDRLHTEQQRTNDQLKKLVSMQENKVDRMSVPPDGWIREVHPNGKVKMIRISSKSK